MDPTTASGLDPKLKEAYDRVMNTTVPSPVQPPPAPVPTPQPSAQIAQPMPTPVPANPVPDNKPQTKAPIMFNAASAKSAHSGIKILPIIILLGGIVFFAVYAVFWTKVFGLAVPFLPF